MGLTVKYKPDRNDAIVKGFEVMLENLYINLKLTDQVTSEMDTDEEYRKLWTGIGIGAGEESPTDDELQAGLEESKNESIQTLGHIQKRIEEVRFLKEAFESPAIPSDDIIDQAYHTLRSSLLFEAMNLGMCNPVEQIMTTGSVEFEKEKAEEVQQLGKTVKTYSEALMFGFRLSPMFWNEFPFDSP